MPSYKLLGIYSFADNLKKINIDDPVVLKSDKFNVKSKNAIGVYTTDNKKIGYLPVENNNEIAFFNNAYKISNLVLNKEYPVVEISRFYPMNNYLNDVEYPYEKKLKYEYVLVNISKELQKSVIGLEKYLETKRIKVKKSAVIYCDENYINVLIEVSKGIEQFECVSLKYFKENLDKFEELNENKLVENTFFRELLFYRLECYFEKNYYSPLKSPQITNIYLLNYVNKLEEENVHEELEIQNKKVDNILLIKLYLRYLFHNNDEYILKYINKVLNEESTNVKKGIKKLIPNYKLVKDVIKDNNLELGKFVYDYKYEMYEYIDFTNDSTVFVISDMFNINYLYNALLTQKSNLVMYNPLKGVFLRVNDIDLRLFN
jgi:hypothetical protein